MAALKQQRTPVLFVVPGLADCAARHRVAFYDSDYAWDTLYSNSTYGYVFKLSSRAVAWSSKKQPVVTPSTRKSYFIYVALCVC
ncbi:hypothetical protein OSB04_001705 [Centaurea solstitialis]|uniref:Uncharacterized protein n=1 Tax=Centaurea solstitialis TaxID=347529 RepID=A0AA38TRU9_9ASTR|nr:hypothetical protein OSB04_001705 [Centaurea solstitialis]